MLSGSMVKPLSAKFNETRRISVHCCLPISKGFLPFKLGLCSKNNINDVNKVLKGHQDMILRDEDISIKRINWNDKVKNLISIAKELNKALTLLASILFIFVYSH